MVLLNSSQDCKTVVFYSSQNRFTRREYSPGGGGGVLLFFAPTLQTSVKFREFEDISLLVFNKSFSNLVRFLILKALFPAESTDFP